MTLKPIDNRITFRASGDLLRALDTRSDDGLSRNLTAKRDLERYYYIIDRAMPELTENEASLICDVMNGTINEPADAIRMLPVVLDDAGREYYEKWNVDKRRLLTNILLLPDSGKAAIIDAVERFWKGGASHPSEVGMCKPALPK